MLLAEIMEELLYLRRQQYAGFSEISYTFLAPRADVHIVACRFCGETGIHGATEENHLAVAELVSGEGGRYQATLAHNDGKKALQGVAARQLIESVQFLIAM